MKLLEDPLVPHLSVASPQSVRGPHGEPLIHLAASRAAPSTLLASLLSKSSSFLGTQTHPLAQPFDGLLPLHIALLMGAPLDTIQFLANSYPVSLTVDAEKGFSPLACALMGKASIEVVRFILQLQGQETCERTCRLGSWEYHALFLALKVSSPIDIVEALVASWPQSVSTPAKSHPDIYPLHFAALYSPLAVYHLALRFPEAARINPGHVSLDGVPLGIPLHVLLKSGRPCVEATSALVKAHPESASMSETLMLAFKMNTSSEIILALTKGSPLPLV